VLARAGRIDEARELAHSITGIYQHDEAMAALAGMLAEAGQPAQAAVLVRAIVDSDHRAEALAKLSEHAARAGRLDTARLLLVEALATAPWTDRLSELSTLAPDTLHRILGQLPAELSDAQSMSSH